MEKMCPMKDILLWEELWVELVTWDGQDWKWAKESFQKTGRGGRRTMRRTKEKCSSADGKWTYQGRRMWWKTSRPSIICPSVRRSWLRRAFKCHSFGTFVAGWQPFIMGRRFSYAAPPPRSHLRGIPITSGLIDVRFIKVNEPTGHLLSSWSSTGDDGRRRGGRRATERQPGQIRIGEIKLETKRSHSSPPFFSSSPCNQRGALTSIPVFSHSPIHLASLLWHSYFKYMTQYMAAIYMAYD